MTDSPDAPGLATPTDTTVAIERHFTASPRAVFLCHVEPAILGRWWFPAERPMTGCTVQLVVGGQYRFEAADPEGTGEPLVSAGGFRRIDPAVQIQTVQPVDGDVVATTTIDLIASEDGTSCTYRATTEYPSTEARDAHLDTGEPAARAESLDRLDTLLGAADFSQRGDFTISGTFEAEPRRIFSAFLDPAALTHFWAGPDVATPRDGIVVEAKPGGRFDVRLDLPDGSSVTTEARYMDIVQDERIVWAEPAAAQFGSVTITPETDDTCRVLLRIVNVPNEFLNEATGEAYRKMFGQLGWVLAESKRQRESGGA